MNPIQGFGLLVVWGEQEAFFVTVAHILRDAGLDVPGATVRLSFSPDSIYEDQLVGTVLATDSTRDLALLRAPLPDTDYFMDEWAAGLPSNPTVYRGQEVWFVGRFGEWYVPVDPGVVNNVSSSGRVQIDRFDIQPGSSGAPVFASGGLVGLVTDKITAQSANAVSIQAILEFLETSNVVLPLDSRLARATRYANGEQLAEAFVANKRKESEARVAQSEPGSGDLVGEFSVDGVLLAVHGEYGANDETLLFTWRSAGDGGGNHSEQYLTAIPIKPVADGAPSTTYIGGRGDRFFELDYESTICTASLSRISLRGCLSNGTGVDCSIPARRGFVNCDPLFVDIGSLRIAGSAVDLVSELGDRPMDDAVSDMFGVRFERWSFSLDQLSMLPPDVRTALPAYKPYPAATDVYGLVVSSIEDEDRAAFSALRSGSVLLQVDDEGFSDPEHLVCKLASASGDDQSSDRYSRPSHTFHLLQPQGASISVVRIPDPVPRTSFLIRSATARQAIATAIRDGLTDRGATFRNNENWAMLLPCTVTTAPGNDGLSTAVIEYLNGMGIRGATAWTDRSLDYDEFELMIGTQCVMQ